LEDVHLPPEAPDLHLLQEWDQRVEHEEECLLAVSLNFNLKLLFMISKLAELTYSLR